MNIRKLFLFFSLLSLTASAVGQEWLYVHNANVTNSNSISAYKINPNTGVLTFKQDTPIPGATYNYANLGELPTIGQINTGKNQCLLTASYSTNLEITLYSFKANADGTVVQVGQDFITTVHHHIESPGLVVGPRLGVLNLGYAYVAVAEPSAAPEGYGLYTVQVNTDCSLSQPSADLYTFDTVDDSELNGMAIASFNDTDYIVFGDSSEQELYFFTCAAGSCGAPLAVNTGNNNGTSTAAIGTSYYNNCASAAFFVNTIIGQGNTGALVLSRYSITGTLLITYQFHPSPPYGETYTSLFGSLSEQGMWATWSNNQQTPEDTVRVNINPSNGAPLGWAEVTDNGGAQVFTGQMTEDGQKFFVFQPSSNPGSSVPVVSVFNQITEAEVAGSPFAGGGTSGTAWADAISVPGAACIPSNSHKQHRKKKIG